MATITVTGTYEDGSGLPTSGKVTFTPVVTGSDGTVVFIADPIVAPVAGGVLSKELTTTDTWDIDGAVTYKVVEKIGSTGRTRYFVSLPSSLGASVDIAAVAHYSIPPNQLQLDAQAPVDFTSHLATDHSPITADIASLDARVDALETATAPTFYELPVDGIPQADLDAATEAKLDGAIQKTIVDAKGDIIAATAADTVSRLATGTNGQVLTVDTTTGTGLKWATPSSTSDATKADKSGNLGQFADVADTAPSDGDVLRYDSGDGVYNPVDISTSFAAVDAAGRIVSSAEPQYYLPLLVINEGDTVPTTFPAGGIVFSRPATADLTPVDIGSDTSEAATTLTITTSAAVAVGEYLLLGVCMSAETPTPLPYVVTFSAGAVDTPVITSHQQGTTQIASIYVAKVTTQIPAAATITITVADSRSAMAARAAKTSGVASASAVDQTAVAGAGTGYSYTVTTSSPTVQANELALSMFSWNPGPSETRTVAGTNGWIALGAQLYSHGATDRGGQFFYKELSATGTVSATATMTSTDTPSADSVWAGVVVTIKAA